MLYYSLAYYPVLSPLKMAAVGAATTSGVSGNVYIGLPPIARLTFFTTMIIQYFNLPNKLSFQICNVLHQFSERRFNKPFIYTIIKKSNIC